MLFLCTINQLLRIPKEAHDVPCTIWNSNISRHPRALQLALEVTIYLSSDNVCVQSGYDSIDQIFTRGGAYTDRSVSPLPLETHDKVPHAFPILFRFGAAVLTHHRFRYVGFLVRRESTLQAFHEHSISPCGSHGVGVLLCKPDVSPTEGG
jgi:hypothetical protein